MPVDSCPLNKISPLMGLYKPTNNLTSVLLPEPEGPTKAIVSPVFTEKEMPSIGFMLENYIVKTKVLKVANLHRIFGAQFNGFIHEGIEIMNRCFDLAVLKND